MLCLFILRIQLQYEFLPWFVFKNYRLDYQSVFEKAEKIWPNK
jgi:hypothetical protein